MKKILALLFFTTFLLSTVAQAEPLPRRAWQFGTEVFKYVYEEKSVGVQDKGVMFGLVGSYTSFRDRFSLKLEGRWDLGEVDYSSGETGSVDNIKDYILEGRILAGYDFIQEETRIYTLFSGFGYRYLNDAGGGTISTTGAWGYDRESNYFYIPIGIEGIAILNEKWNVAAVFEYDWLLAGQQKSHLSDVDSRYDDIMNNQNRGNAFRASLKFQYLTEKYDFSIEPFYRWWQIRNSEWSPYTFNSVVVTEAVEPNNTTKEAGVNLSLLF